MEAKTPTKSSNQTPKRTLLTFTPLTKAFLESKDESENREEVKPPTTDGFTDEEQQLHDILKKWRTGDPSPANTISTRISEPKKEEPDPKLESGSKLANRIKIDDSLLGLPLEDIDPFYRKQRSTFVVVGRDRNITRFSATDSLFIFSPFSPIRRAALYVLVHPVFSLLVILTILCNCVFMAMTSPPEVAEYVFTAIYTFEATIKILARGFFLAPYTYIRDAWNILDFVVITLAYITSFVNLGNLSILRTFRVLRALKTVAIVPGLKTIVGALLEAVRRLRDVAFLTLFMLSIFALIGLQLYMGQLSSKCVAIPPPNGSNDSNETSSFEGTSLENETTEAISTVITAQLARNRRSFLISYVDSNFSSIAHEFGSVGTKDAATLVSLTSSGNADGLLHLDPSDVADNEADDKIILTADSEWARDPQNWLEGEEGGYRVCGASKCPEGYTCVPRLGDNPDFGFTSFDNYGWAMFAGFRLMTQDCWELLFHQIIAAAGTYHVVYFVLVIFLGSFYLINLILAIVAMSYQDLQTQEEAAAAEERREEEEDERMMGDAGDENIDNRDLQTPRHVAINYQVAATTTSQNPNLLSAPTADEQYSLVKRDAFYAKRSFELSGLTNNTQGGLKPPSRQISDRLPYSNSRRSSLTGGDQSSRTGDRRSLSRQTSRTASPTTGRRRKAMASGSVRVSLPYLDDSQAITPTSEMIYNDDFHISDYIMAIQRLTYGSTLELQTMQHQNPQVDDSLDSRSVVNVESTITQITQQQSWRLAALRRGSASIDDEGIIVEHSTSPQFKPHRKLDKRPAVDDAASILAIDVFTATPRRYRRIPIPMMDDTSSRFGDSNLSGSRLSVAPGDTVQTMVAIDKRGLGEEDRLIQREIVVIAVDDDLPYVDQMDDGMPRVVEPCFIRSLRACWNSKAHDYFEMFVNDPFVDLFITMCIVVNTLFMALDHHGMSHTFEEHLRHGNYFFTAVFATESVLKILALSPCRYFVDPWNVFDSFIVFLSLVELGLEGVQGLSVLRTFRLLRVFKLARSWPTLNLLIGIIGRTLGALGNLTFVLGIIVFIFAVMGMQLFGKFYRQNVSRFPDGELPRWHFEDFTHSFMIVFRVLCGEWVESTWDCMLVYGWPCIPFFVLTLVVGNLVVLNLFLALLLDSFSSENIQSIMGEKSNEPNKLAEAIDRFARFYDFLKVKVATLLHIDLTAKVEAPALEYAIAAFSGRRGGAVDAPAVQEGDEITVTDVSICDAHRSSSQQNMTRSSTLPSIRPRAISLAPQLMRMRGSPQHVVVDCCPKCCYRRFPFIDKMMETPTGVWFKNFRLNALKLIEHKYFESTVITLIIISSLALAIEDINTRQNKMLMSVLEIMDKCFSVIFAIEMCLKWIALGFRRYFADGWCWLDFVIVTVSIVSWVAEGAGLGNLGAFRALRTLRALRPLRAVSRWEGMKIVVNALLQAIPSICNVFLVCIVFWLIFSIMGVQLFAGKFHKCVDGEGKRLPVELVPNRTECLGQNFTWSNSKINFDNVGRAYLSLFQVATFSGWIEIIADAVDAVEIDQQPYREASLYFYFYFVLFIIFGSFFTLNLFIGVIIENFNKQKKRSGGSIEMFMTDEQKKYYNAMKKLKNKSPQKPIPKPKMWFHAKLFAIVTDQRFDVFIMVIIMFNMLQMCLEHDQQPALFTLVLTYTNTFFVAIFTGEFILKLIAFRHYYFTQPWNVFDSVVVVLSIIASALADYMSDFPISPTILRVVRVFRVGRVLRLVKSAKGIRTLLFSLAVSLPALFNIGLLLLLVIFIYACFGMSFFTNVRLTEGLDEQFNFQTFINSVLLLFQLATSAGWDGVLLALLNDSPPTCDPTPTEFSPIGDCSNSTVAVIYLVSYIIISFMIVINMYIAVILENFGEATQDIQQGLTQDDFDAFFEKWEHVDPTASQYIPIERLSDFVDSLEPPLKIKAPNWRAIVILDPPVCTDMRIHCDDIVTMLVRNAVAGSVSNAADAPELDLADILSKEKPEYKVIASLSQIDSAARRIQRKWKKRRRQRRLMLTRANTVKESKQHQQQQLQIELQIEMTEVAKRLETFQQPEITEVTETSLMLP